MRRHLANAAFFFVLIFAVAAARLVAECRAFTRRMARAALPRPAAQVGEPMVDATSVSRGDVYLPKATGKWKYRVLEADGRQVVYRVVGGSRDGAVGKTTAEEFASRVGRLLRSRPAGGANP